MSFLFFVFTLVHVSPTLLPTGCSEVNACISIDGCMTENLFSVMHISNDIRRIELADKHF